MCVQHTDKELVQEFEHGEVSTVAVLTKAGVRISTKSLDGTSSEFETFIPSTNLLNCFPCSCPLGNYRPQCDALPFMASSNRNKCTRCRHSHRTQASPIRQKLAEDLQLRIYYGSATDEEGRWKLLSVLICFEDVPRRDAWMQRTMKLIEANNSPRKLLVFINPYGGTKKAKTLYYKKVAPVFLICGIRCTVVVTTFSGHSKEYLLEKDCSGYDGVVCVGGDGMANEVINGVVLRAQKEAGLPTSDDQGVSYVQATLPVGVIPAGSTDALVCSTTGAHCPVTSALHIAMGTRVKVDLGSIHHGGRLVRFFSGFLSYGFFGDNVQTAEKYRWMGPLRYTWTGWQTFLKNTSYSGQLKVNVPSGEPDRANLGLCMENCERCSSAPRTPPHSRRQSTVNYSGKLLSLSCSLITNRCCKSRGGFAPFAHLGDGIMDVCLVERSSRTNFLRFLTAVGNSHTRNPFDFSFVRSFRAVSFDFAPQSAESSEQKRRSVWHCDGEVLSATDIQVSCHCQLLELFAPGIPRQDDDTSTQKTSSSTPEVSSCYQYS